ncbi:MAG: outer membrane protein assembly factor BamE, partial [Pyrinomonadaceae bacterium]
MKTINKIRQNAFIMGSLFMLIGFSGSIVFSQTETLQMAPAISDLKGVSVGMTKAEVKEVLGKPKMSDKTSMNYTFSKTETAQIGFDGKGKARTIAVIYTNGDGTAPSFSDIFGPDVPLVEGKNGGVYKLIRYPSAGFYIAYSRTM